MLRLLSILILGVALGGGAVLLANPGSSGQTPQASLTAVNAVGSSSGHVHGGTTASLTGTTPCERSGPPASAGQEEHGHRGPFPWTAITDAATRNVLQQQLATANAVTLRFPTVQTAEAAGYHMTTTYVPCIGAHYINPAYLGSFDPAHPAMLL